jgi:RNase P protein component
MFKKVGYKCERDRYKRALEDAIRKAGVELSMGMR